MMRRGLQPFRRGVSLIEAAVCVAITGGLAAAALTAAGQTSRAREAASERGRAMALASSLMSEIRGRPYSAGTPLPASLLKSKAGQARGAFDELADYHGLDDSPPLSEAGDTMAGGEWRRLVRVEFVQPTKPDASTLIDTGLRRIEVMVLKNDRPIVTLHALRTEAGEAEPQ
jgi:hypothetical protein